MIDAIAGQGHFADHIRPIWNALPAQVRGRFYEGTVPVVGPRNPTLVASSSDMKRAQAKGRPIAMMEHGCGQSFGGDQATDKFSSYAGHSGRDAVDLFLHPGQHPADRDRKRYPDARVEVIGCAKLDTLPGRDGSGPVVAVSFHWNCTICPETSSAWPAFKEQVKRLTRHFEVIGHGHPRNIARMERDYRKMGIETVRSFEDVCRRADIYVNDCSSTLFEFASTGRPVVVLNDSRYRRTVHHGLRFWKAATVGVNVEESGDLVEGVRRALEDGPDLRAGRENALDLVYAYRSGAAQRGAAALMDWAGVEHAAVA